MSNEQDLQKISISMAQAKECVATADALVRLKKNKDFKKVFIDGYMNKDVRRWVTLKTHMHMQGEKDQRYMEQQINAVGFFEQYMLLIEQTAVNMRSSIAADEEEQKLILEEEENNA